MRVSLMIARNRAECSAGGQALLTWAHYVHVGMPRAKLCSEKTLPEVAIKMVTMTAKIGDMMYDALAT